MSRWTYVVKRGRRDEALALFKQRELSPEQAGITVRVYKAATGLMDTIAEELESESMAEFEKGYAEWRSTPEFAAWAEKVIEITEPGGTHEIWRLIE